ncbi:MAG: antibiotic biosynthesis monooxygenase [Nitrospinota bacterium]|nr:antibiotic biosynthesis monooxygenase [Nitrospinota bacterium]MEE3253829.1 antibiotic biosynthesis monooxygenase [Nitrospinota bacterium]
MPIIITASYQVRPQTIDKCKRATENLVEYVKENEEGTLFYIAKQEKLNPYAFLHTMIFKDEVALTLHRSSEAAEKFVSIVYPSAIDPLEFKEYESIANNLKLSHQ